MSICTPSTSCSIIPDDVSITIAQMYLSHWKWLPRKHNSFQTRGSLYSVAARVSALWRNEVQKDKIRHAVISSSEDWRRIVRSGREDTASLARIHSLVICADIFVSNAELTKLFLKMSNLSFIYWAPSNFIPVTTSYTFPPAQIRTLQIGTTPNTLSFIDSFCATLVHLELTFYKWDPDHFLQNITLPCLEHLDIAQANYRRRGPDDISGGAIEMAGTWKMPCIVTVILDLEITDEQTKEAALALFVGGNNIKTLEVHCLPEDLLQQALLLLPKLECLAFSPLPRLHFPPSKIDPSFSFCHPTLQELHLLRDPPNNFTSIGDLLDITSLLNLSTKCPCIHTFTIGKHRGSICQTKRIKGINYIEFD